MRGHVKDGRDVRDKVRWRGVRDGRCEGWSEGMERGEGWKGLRMEECEGWRGVRGEHKELFM